jgi:nitrous oxidase accessory protein
MGALLLVQLGCSGTGATPASARPLPLEAHTAPARPALCHEVSPGTPLQPLFDTAQPGEAYCLQPGRYTGPLHITKPLRLWGTRSSVIHAEEGTTVHVTASGTVLEGFTVDGSGTRVDLLDGAVKVQADDVTVSGVAVMRATFGILSERSKRLTVRDCVVTGSGDSALGMRGDAIRLWETHHSRVENNHVEQSRDMVVWYSSDNVLTGNTVVNGRYGMHFMFSHGNTVERNRFSGNTVGVFLMYSRNVRLQKNVIVDSSGSAGIGVGVKESGNLVITDNQLVHNTVGVYLDTSPLQQDDWNRFERNEIRLGQTGVVFHSSQQRNAFTENTFRDNQMQVSVEGGGDALGVTWTGNNFDDYVGYDLDGDGYGDLPYELRSLSGDLTSRTPELSFFRGAAALSLVEAVGHAVPILAPKLLLKDPRPRVAAPETKVADAR